MRVIHFVEESFLDRAHRHRLTKPFFSALASLMTIENAMLNSRPEKSPGKVNSQAVPNNEDFVPQSVMVAFIQAVTDN
ncbi:MAG: hypothetical protein KDA89_20990, partial [Planctomycetaceae bacterium]|nr:hypothetical protein [Planctomycetaceae bacterium]